MMKHFSNEISYECIKVALFIPHHMVAHTEKYEKAIKGQPVGFLKLVVPVGNLISGFNACQWPCLPRASGFISGGRVA